MILSPDIRRWFAIAAGAALWAAGAATPASAAPAASNTAMQLGERAAAPRGYLDFCRRQPADCGPDAAAVLSQVDQAQVEGLALTAVASAAAASISPAAAAPARPAGDAAKVARMGPTLWARLNRVNEVVNKSLSAQSDAQTYGVADYWATPLEEGSHLGDCEDYVLEKQRALLASGIPREALSIAVVQTSLGDTHAVLLVKTQDEELVLDNLSPAIAPWWATPYRWTMRQRPGRPFEWVRISSQP